MIKYFCDSCGEETHDPHTINIPTQALNYGLVDYEHYGDELDLNLEEHEFCKKCWLTGWIGLAGALKLNDFSPSSSKSNDVIQWKPYSFELGVSSGVYLVKLKLNENTLNLQLLLMNDEGYWVDQTGIVIDFGLVAEYISAEDLIK